MSEGWTPEPEASPAESSLGAVVDEAGALADVMALWTELYALSRRRYGAYAREPDDPAQATAIATHARDLATEERARREPNPPPLEKLEDELLRHWIKNYLRADGTHGWLVERRHPLRYLLRDVPTLGLPWGHVPRVRIVQPPALKPDEPPAVPPPAEVLAALRGFIGGPLGSVKRADGASRGTSTNTREGASEATG